MICPAHAHLRITAWLLRPAPPPPPPPGPVPQQQVPGSSSFTTTRKNPDSDPPGGGPWRYIPAFPLDLCAEADEARAAVRRGNKRTLAHKQAARPTGHFELFPSPPSRRASGREERRVLSGSKLVSAVLPQHNQRCLQKARKGPSVIGSVFRTERTKRGGKWRAPLRADGSQKRHFASTNKLNFRGGDSGDER